MDQIPRVQVEFPAAQKNSNLVLSAAATKTIQLIKKYQVHSCPDNRNYIHTLFMTFRNNKNDGLMDTIYCIDKIIRINPLPKDDLSKPINDQITDNQLHLTPYEEERLRIYREKNIQYPENNRFYILSIHTDLRKGFKPNAVNTDAIY